MLRLRYLYAEPLPPAPQPRILATPTLAEGISRHLERVGNETRDFRLRRDLLASSSRLVEAGLREVNECITWFELHWRIERRRRRSSR